MSRRHLSLSVLALAMAACQATPPEAVAPTSMAPGAATAASEVGLEPNRAAEPTSAAPQQGKALTFLGVTERDGKPLGGAEVTVLRLDTNQPVAQATTFADGSFSVAFGADLPPTLPIKVVAKLNGEALGAVVAGGPLAIVAGGAGNIVAGGAGNIVAGGAGNIVAGGAGNIVAGGAGNIVAGGAGNIVAGGAGNIVAGGAGNLAAGLPASSLNALNRAGAIVAGGAGNFSSGNVLTGGVGNVIVAAPASIQAAVAAGIVAGGAGNIVAGGAGNIVAGGAGNIVAGGAGNRRLLQASPQPSPTASSGTVPAIRLSLASSAAVLILERRVRAYAQASGQSFIQAAAAVADAVFEGLTGFLATSPTLTNNEAAQRLLTTALAEGGPLPPTVAANLTSGTDGLSPTIVDAAVRLGLVVLGTATATNTRPSEDVLSGFEVGNSDVPPVALPETVGRSAPTVPDLPSRTSSDVVPSAAPSYAPGQNPVAFPSGGAAAIGNPGLNGPGPQPSSFPGLVVGFSPLAQAAPAVVTGVAFVHGGWLYVAGGSATTAGAGKVFRRARLDSDGLPGAFENLPDLPDNRYGHQVVLDGDTAYLLGGQGGNGEGYPTAVLAADLAASTPSFVAQTQRLARGMVHGSAFLAKTGVIWLVGGMFLNAQNNVVAQDKAVRWSPTASSELTFTATPAIASLAAQAGVMVDGKAYMIGGFTGASPQSRVFQITFDAEGDWSGSLTDLGITAPALAHAKAVLHPKGGHVYLMGGISSNSNDSRVDQVHRFPVTGGALGNAVALSGSNVKLHLARQQHAAVAQGQRILVLGGLAGNSTTTQMESAYLP